VRVELRSIAELKNAYSSKNNLDQLSNWYLERCNGSWEHISGIEINTLDNPGWTVEIDLTGTELENKSFLKIQLLGEDRDWLVCEVLNEKYSASCGPAMLSIAIGVFLEWASSVTLK
jgi:hypothetical protein